ncbi:hypothetical protein F5X98DRAFT_380498 [Xylaria grammica]|nr:hypothetical protein F5X98DRAFT_380498 [Xylaria grammica]
MPSRSLCLFTHRKPSMADLCATSSIHAFGIGSARRIGICLGVGSGLLGKSDLTGPSVEVPISPCARMGAYKGID